jgi:hypothetical protein
MFIRAAYADDHDFTIISRAEKNGKAPRNSAIKNKM